MNIIDCCFDDDYEEYIRKSFSKREDTSKRLSKIEEDIGSGKKEINSEYYNAYLDYIKADDEHMKTFLYFFKNAYDMCEKEKLYALPIGNRMEALKDMQKKLSDTFDTYYAAYLYLSDLNKKLEKQILEVGNVSIKENPVKVAELHGFLMVIDAMHTTKANEVEKFRNENMLPLLSLCDDLCDGYNSMEDIEEGIRS